MSSYHRLTKHPITGAWEKALWADDALGHHHYGVRFPSEPSKTYDPEIEDLETKQGDEGLETHNGTHEAPRLERSSVTYEIHHVIPCASASHTEPHVCTNRDIKARVTVSLPDGSVTLTKLDAPKNRYGDSGNTSWVFQNSDPELVRAVGEMLIAAANASRNTLEGNTK